MLSMTHFFGGYPSISEMIKHVKEQKSKDELPKIVWVYYGVFVVMSIAYFIIQWKTTKPKKNIDEGDKEE